MKEYPRTLAAVESFERSRWPIADALMDEIGTTKGGSAKDGEYARVAAFLKAKGYPSYGARRIQDFYLVGQWVQLSGQARQFQAYPFERVYEARKKARNDHEAALALLASTKTKRDIRPDKLTSTQIIAAMKDLPDAAIERVEKAAADEVIERHVYGDRPKPKYEDTVRRQKAKQSERLAANPEQAASQLGVLLGRGRAITRQITIGYQDFLALVEDEDWREYGRERLAAYHADVEIALTEALKGSFDEALRRLLEEEAA